VVSASTVNAGKTPSGEVGVVVRDDRRVFVRSEDDRIWIWDPASGKVTAPGIGAYKGWPKSVEDGYLISLGTSGFAAWRDNIVSLWSADGEYLGELGPTSERIGNLYICERETLPQGKTKTGQKAAFLRTQSTVEEWELDPPRFSRLFVNPIDWSSPLHDVSVRDDCGAIALVSGDDLFVLDTHDGTPFKSPFQLLRHITFARWQPAGKLLAIDWSGRYPSEVLNLEAGKRVPIGQPPSQGFLWGDDGKYLVGAIDDGNGNSYIYEAETGRRIVYLSLWPTKGVLGWTGQYEVLAPGGDRALSQGISPKYVVQLFLWDLLSGKRIAEIARPSPIVKALWKPREGWLVLVDQSGLIRVLAMKDGKLLHEFHQMDFGEIDAAFFVGQTLVTGTKQGMYGAWNVERGTGHADALDIHALKARP